ncbi:hypothetical protein EYF80_041913 [Liparis tanakae]|uniref:Uncharacterized protein n=1 Tax=Liparis tanakae TaxID=230148 RepID=A0A4Z2G5P2_9TELE|nr:hypothetical protein EYF80_041913 [Liparis tanakae]
MHPVASSPQGGAVGRVGVALCGRSGESSVCVGRTVAGGGGGSTPGQPEGAVVVGIVLLTRGAQAGGGVLRCHADHASWRSSARRFVTLWAEPPFGGSGGGGASAARLLCSWLYMKVSWWARVTEPITSSSPLSEAVGEAELVSMATAGSGLGPASDWPERGAAAGGAVEGARAGPTSSEVGSVGVASRGLPMGSVWLLCSWLCSWLLFIMLFMALCISSSMRCFSRFGIRPKRTAGRGGEEPVRTAHLDFALVYSYSLVRSRGGAAAFLSPRKALAAAREFEVGLLTRLAAAGRGGAVRRRGRLVAAVGVAAVARLGPGVGRADVGYYASWCTAEDMSRERRERGDTVNTELRQITVVDSDYNTKTDSSADWRPLSPTTFFSLNLISSPAILSD